MWVARTLLTVAAFLRALLANAAAGIPPIRLIRRIPAALEIPDLRATLIDVLRNAHSQVSLLRGCAGILVADARTLAVDLHRSQTTARRATLDTTCAACSRPALSKSAAPDSGVAMTAIFFCGHVAHVGCVLDDVPVRRPSSAAGHLSERTRLTAELLARRKMRCGEAHV